MLDSHILGMDYGSSYGSGSLKALQNDNLPEIDLLVREAIQNSSDASLRESGDSFGVSLNYKTFSPKQFNDLLSDVKDILNERYPESEADYLEIRDYKTSGLTGSVRRAEVAQFPDDHGNYFKLVFDTGKEQTNSDDGMAGGSWGYGKSVYFRFGIGLVLFYSQIKTDGGYESRLIVALVEHENSENAILSGVREDAIGRAWWGRRDAEDSTELLPITDLAEIKEILNVFGVEPFGLTETGTSIIIPYIDKEKLMDGIFPEHCGISEDVISMCSFKDDIVEYTKLAIQKWYAPKIFNKNLAKYSNQKWLAVRVNGVGIKNTDMRPLFQLVQELYTSALSANKFGKQDYNSELFRGIKSVPVPSKKVQGDRAGFVSTVIVTNKELGSTGAIIPPQAYLRLFGMLTQNDPIVMYARAAGMVLDYKIEGKWTKGLIKPEGEDEMLISFFVPDCGLKLKEDKVLGEYSGMSLGNYLRKCEKSDHMAWTDPSSLTVVTNIASQTTAKINDCYRAKSSAESEGTASKLSGKLGRKLLPTLSFGKKKGGFGGPGGAGGSGGTINNLDCILRQSIISADSMTIEFELRFKNIRKEAFIGVFVESEVGLMDAHSWKTGIGTVFPIEIPIIANCSVMALNSNQMLMFDSSCTKENRYIENDFSTIEVVYTEDGDALGFKVTNTVTNAVVKGTLTLKSRNKKYCCTVKEAKEPVV